MINEIVVYNMSNSMEGAVQVKTNLSMSLHKVYCKCITKIGFENKRHFDGAQHPLCCHSMDNLKIKKIYISR